MRKIVIKLIKIIIKNDIYHFLPIKGMSYRCVIILYRASYGRDRYLAYSLQLDSPTMEEIGS
jgi:hypothetical protein